MTFTPMLVVAALAIVLLALVGQLVPISWEAERIEVPGPWLLITAVDPGEWPPPPCDEVLGVAGVDPNFCPTADIVYQMQISGEFWPSWATNAAPEGYYDPPWAGMLPPDPTLLSGDPGDWIDP